MKIIEKIEIKHFRSFDGGKSQAKVEIIDLNDVNVFSGANDAGKSNILRALNLFFNNEISPNIPFNLDRDLSKVQKIRSDANAKSKRAAGKKDVRQKDLWVKIRIYFQKEEGGVLPESFFVEKTWDKNGLNPNKKHNIKANRDVNKTRAQEGQLTQFLNNISFEYIPAVKDRQFFNLLFKKLQTYLFEKQDKKHYNKFKEHSQTFNDLLKTETKNLFEEFKKNVGISAEFRIPETLVDFFRTLGVETENGISLFDRGDGIQARFIPEILNEISKDSRKKIIWGFEEPENSYEPLKCFDLAHDFLKYSEKKQIFITSHAFPFISLAGEGVSSYRVRNEKNVSQIGKVDWGGRLIRGQHFENDAEKLEKEVGILETYNKIFELLKMKIEKAKCSVFVEDSKTQIYKIAWLKLHDIECTEATFKEVFKEKCKYYLFEKEGRHELRKYLDMSAVAEMQGDKIIGVFDFDDAFEDFRGLDKKRWEKIVGNKSSCFLRKRKKHQCFYSLLIPVPTFRDAYADFGHTHNYLTLEHLFDDDTLREIDCYNGVTRPSGGVEVVRLKGKSMLWRKLFDIPKEKFNNFKPLFDKIDQLFK